MDNYYLDERKHWILKHDDTVIKSPISQVLKYKDNLFELHIESLLEQKIKDLRKFNEAMKCQVNFAELFQKLMAVAKQQGLLIDIIVKDCSRMIFSIAFLKGAEIVAEICA